MHSRACVVHTPLFRQLFRERFSQNRVQARKTGKRGRAAQPMALVAELGALRVVRAGDGMPRFAKWGG